jgi:cysteine desulfurase
MIYFDHAATTPVSDSVLAAMKPYFQNKFGNPSSIYSIGREAKQALEDAREKAALLIGSENPRNIIFTSGATESNNFVIKGVYFYASRVLNIKPHIIVSSVEHHCVLDTAKYLEKYFGAEVTYMPVDHEGLVDPKELWNEIKENTILVSVMYGNNETGSVEPIKEIGEIVAKQVAIRTEKHNQTPIFFHTDAVQAYQFLGIDVKELGVDFLSLTAHKFYGPKGVGLLYVKRDAKYLPQQQGGAQERNLRAGTENVPYIVGMVQAMEDAQKERDSYKKQITELRNHLTERIVKEIPEVEVIGPKDEDKRLPHIATFLFKRVEGESILINLDMLGICASSGSACTSGSLEPSHVTKAMGYGDLEAHGSVRFSMGKLNKKEDIDELMKHLPGIVEKLRGMSPIK